FERSGRPILGGAALGVATAVKLFPGFLFLFLLMRRSWTALLAGAAAFLTLNGAALVMIGQGAFHDYFQTVLPALERYRSFWGNVSLSGVGLRTFNPDQAAGVIALCRCPELATLLAYASQAIAILVAAAACWKSAERGKTDEAFAVCLVGMLLVSPI